MKGRNIYSLAILALTVVACGSQQGEGVEAQSGPLGVQMPLEVDATPPVSTTTVQPQANPDGTHYGAVSITITATDEESGVESITYTLSGAQEGSNTVQGSIAYVPIIVELGVTTVTFYAKDLAGNYEVAQTLEINRVPEPANCTEISLRDFNLYLQGDYTGGHDVEGKVAVAGNITMEHFSVGHGQPADDIDNVLVAGGDLNITHGGVHGNAYYGNTTTANGTVVFPRGSLSEGYPVDFWTRTDELIALSSELGWGQVVNGTVRREPWGGLFLEGTDPNMNVFSMDGEDFTGAKYLSISAPANSMVVVNIHGDSATFTGFGHSYSGVDQRSILFNFPTATNITAYGYGFWGTVLAPYAHVDFSDGSFDGGLYAYSMSGNAEGHINPLRDFVLCGGGVGQ